MENNNRVAEEAVQYIARMSPEKQEDALNLLKEMSEEEEWTKAEIDAYNQELEEADAEIERGIFTPHEEVMANTKTLLAQLYANSLEQKR